MLTTEETWEEDTAETVELKAEISLLKSLLAEAGGYIGYASCHGFKCRLPHCHDCNMEPDLDGVEKIEKAIRVIKLEQLMTYATELNDLEGSTEKLYTHSLEDCDGDVCPIHKLTEHHMRSFPQLWRSDRKIMERTCSHGVGHPDPDDVLNEDKVHGCDGCCVPPWRAP